MPTNVDRDGGPARKDAPTCRPQERLRDVRERVRRSGWDACAVVNGQRVVLGMLRDQGPGADPNAAVEQVMHPGPRTFRPNVPPDAPLRYVRKHGLKNVLTTTSDGVLVGLLPREDAARHAQQREAGERRS